MYIDSDIKHSSRIDSNDNNFGLNRRNVCLTKRYADEHSVKSNTKTKNL